MAMITLKLVEGEFQSLYFCQEDAFDMMDKSREVVGKDINTNLSQRC